MACTKYNTLSHSNVDVGNVTLSATSASVEEGEAFTITVTLDLPGAGMTLSPPLTVIVFTVDGTAGRSHNMYALCD